MKIKRAIIHIVALVVLLMTTTTAWAAQPDSYLDACTGGLGHIHVQGWAYDPDAPSQSIDVHMYVYTDADCTSQYGYMTEFTAGVPRADVNSSKGITGDHGFNIDIPMGDPGVYWVKLFAIDMGGDGDTQIGSTRTVTVAGYGPPIGSLEVCTGGEELIHVQGWAYDPDVPSQSINVNVYVYTDEGCTSQYGDVHVLTAGVPRSDVNSSKGITGDHGFSADIAIADVGNYWVKVIAIDMGGDGDTQTGATTAVTVSYPSWLRPGDAWDNATKTLTVNTVGQVAYQAYQGQTEIEHVIIGSSVTFFGGYDFCQCSNLKTVTFAENSPLTIIGYRAFMNCTNLESITLPDHVAKIEAYAFYNCTSLTTIHIPASLTTVEELAFGDCTSLTTFTVDDASTTLASDDGVLTNKDGTSLVCYPPGRTATSYTVPESMTEIPSYTFSSCTALETVILPKGLEKIGSAAFSGCTGLTSITIPPNVTKLDGSSFYGCTSLSTFIALPEDSPYGPSTALRGINKDCQFYVRSASYKKSNVFSGKKNMTVFSVVNTAAGATATASSEPLITYDGTEYYVTGTTFAISRIDVTDVPTGYEKPFQNYVVTDNLGEDISATVFSGATLTLPESDVTIRARFTPIVYNITYDLDGGIADPANPETYTIESNITLNAPERDGFYFAGWTGTGLTEPTKSVTIPSGLTGDRAYTATWAHPTYIDADGIERVCTVAKRIKDTGGSQEFDDKSVEEAWYYVNSHEEIQGSLLFKARNTHIILFDDAVLTLDSENYNVFGTSLHIYGQTQSTGQLILQNHENGPCSGIIASNLTINGGKVYIYSYKGDSTDEYIGLAILATQHITINGGYIEAYTTDAFDKAILALGDITLGWRLPTDEIFTRHYQVGGDLIIKPGQSFRNMRSNILTGTLTGIAPDMINTHTLFPCYAVNFDANGGNFSGAASVLSATEFDSNGEAHVSAPATDPTRDGYVFNGWKLGEDDFDFSAAVTSNLTLTAKWLSNGLELANASDNGDAITKYAGKTIDVTLSGRTLYKDGAWNTLCLPFDYDLTDTEGKLYGATVKELDAETSGLSGGTLTLNFKDVMGTMTAGRPYIVKWTKPNGYTVDGGFDIVDPTFEGVTIAATAPVPVDFSEASEGVFDVTFTGNFDPVSIPAEGDATKLYLAAANTLYWPNAAMQLGTHRAYFQLNNGITCGQSADPNAPGHVRAFVLDYGDGSDETAIRFLSTEAWRNGDSWYTLDGVRLSDKPAVKGLYIHDGRKVVTK